MRKQVKEILYTHEFLGFALWKFRKHTPKAKHQMHIWFKMIIIVMTIQ